METYKILTGKERLNLKTFFHLFQLQVNSNVAWVTLAVAHKYFEIKLIYIVYYHFITLVWGA